MWWDGGWHMGWMWLFGPMGLLLFLIFVVVLVQSRGGPGPESRETPEQILKRRYAAGEIDHDEFERRLDDLRH